MNDTRVICGDALDVLRVERVWSWPSKWTFEMPPVRRLLGEELTSGVWGDPFAGMTSPAQVRNDLNPESPAEFHMDALEFLQAQESGAFDGVLWDPPYSNRQASDCYKSFGLGQHSATVTNNGYWAKAKDEVARIVVPGGKVLCFGWHSNGIGMTRGFDLKRVLVIAHGGGSRNDTICTVEVKRQPEDAAQPPLFVQEASA